MLGISVQNRPVIGPKPAAIRSSVLLLPPRNRTSPAHDEGACASSVVQNGCDQVFRMKIRIGFEMIYDFPQPTPLIALVGTHFTRASDILVPDYLTISPSGGLDRRVVTLLAVLS
jgi:hypothetical protein